jgi:hypothetical protein
MEQEGMSDERYEREDEQEVEQGYARTTRAKSRAATRKSMTAFSNEYSMLLDANFSQ